MTLPEAAQAAWYRQPWLWLLILLPAAMVVAAVLTLVIAVYTDDAVVSNDYYRDGLAINVELAKLRFARERDLHGVLRYDAAAHTVLVELQGAIAWPDSLRLHLSHPTDARQDAVLLLQHEEAGQYRGAATWTGRGKRYVQIEAGVTSPWRLRGTLNIDDALSTSTAVSAE